MSEGVTSVRAVAGHCIARRPRRWLTGIAGAAALLGFSVLAAPAASAAGAGAATDAASQHAAARPAELAAAHAPGDNFGYSVAVAGKTAVIGAPGVKSASGAAYIYVRSGRTWRRQAVLADPRRDAGDEFGYSAAVSGKTAVIGAWASENHAGAAYIYARSGSTWRRQAALADPRGTSNDAFGYSVAVSGTTVMIGSFGAGTVSVYARSGSAWRLRDTLSGPAGSSTFGAATALSATTAVIGAWGTNDQAGAADIYVRSGSTWRRQATLNPTGASPDHFGSSVAVSGNTVVIGAPVGVGTASVYVRSGSTWRRRATLGAHASDPRRRDLRRDRLGVDLPRVGGRGRHFGWSVAVSGTSSGTRVLAGAPSTGSACGAAYEFVRSGRHWRKRATVVEPRCSAADNVGYSVALAGRLAVIGEPGKNGAAGAVITLRVP